MKIIFTDTNKLFGAYRYFINHDFTLGTSKLIELTKEFDLVLSYFVLQEMVEICERKNMLISKEILERFCNYIGIFITPSQKIKDDNISMYVNDINDSQILQDAIYVKADILLTDNLKDFRIALIKNDFDIIVINHI